MEFIHISYDPEEDEFQLWAYPTTTSEEPTARKCVCRRVFSELLLAAGGLEPTKRCPHCADGAGAVKPISAFPRDRNSVDGHGVYCTTCNREVSKAGMREVRAARQWRGRGKTSREKRRQQRPRPQSLTSRSRVLTARTTSRV